MKTVYNKLTMDDKQDRRPMSRYPRPSMVRDSFMCLNGTWDGGIVVPYPLESENSGFTGEVPETFTYSRNLCIDKSFIKDRLILHFGAVDCECTVKIDDRLVGTHVGGYLPFEFDITDFVFIDEVQKLTVEVKDELSPIYPYGKQKKNRGGMWYTPVTGIWQSVWLESVPKNYIKGFTITPSLDHVVFDIDSYAQEFEVSIYDKGMLVFSGKFDDSYFLVNISNPKLWTPDEPNLYDVVIKAGEDEVRTYFGLRTVSIAEVDGVSRILLNGKPFFFHGVLDQGYFPEGIYTPNSEETYENDIRRLKALGINTIRKHIKVEPECFYEACDRIGMLVFQDMVNNGDYRFLRDTVMPTFVSQKLDDTKKRYSYEQREFFCRHMEDTLYHLYNFPCIVYYTIFNEGWGQFDADFMYDLATANDGSRIFDATSGWFWQSQSDVDSYHVYFKPFLMKKSKRPVILSEFGGYSLKMPEHSFNPKKNYGYGKAADINELTSMIVELYEKEIIPAIPQGLCGTIYTQATDVEDETNGFFTYDRKVCKVDAQRMRELAKKLTI